jgi:hypothetical protein
MRKLYVTVQKAVKKVLKDLWVQQLAFIISRDVADRISNLHYTPLHWTVKKGKECGRYLFDSSDDKSGQALNSDEATEKLREVYGDIVHPTIQKLVIMVLDFIDQKRKKYLENFRQEDVVLWIADLKQAFTLLSFSVDDCHKFASELTDRLVIVYHTGIFGWTGTPFCFQVLTRTICKNTRRRLRGNGDMFVDDFMGVTMKKDLQHDQDFFFFKYFISLI